MKKGISLITLGVTIVVMLILAGAVILSVINNDPTGSAKEATFKSDVKAYEEELSAYVSNQYAVDPWFDSYSVNAAGNDMKSIITKMKDEHTSMFRIVEGILVLDGSVASEAEELWATEAGIGVINSDSAGNPGDPGDPGGNTDNETYGTNGNTTAGVSKVNSPVLAGMQPVRWEGTTEDNSITASSPNWYAYVAGDNSVDSKKSMWANAKTSDGSYWVWIPRYAYKIIYTNPSAKQVEGKIDVVFLKGTTNQYDDNGTLKDAVANGYIVHPAFTFGTTHLTGIWVAKYTASHSDAAVATAGNTAPNKGNSTDLKIVPNVVSWTNILLKDAFETCYTMASKSRYGLTGVSDGDTHMMKNVEWGACAYLAHSQYGRNGKRVQVNNNNNHITGCAGETATASGTSTLNAVTDTTSNRDSFPYNNTYRGVLASTTGNIYGIYDMAGGSYEYVAANVYEFLSDAGYQAGTNFTRIYNGTDTALRNKYFDIYKNEYTSEESEKNQKNYEANSDKKGDAIVETSSGFTSTSSWWQNTSVFINEEAPWFIRCGHGNLGASTGIFHYNSSTGSANSGISFRPVLCVAAP